MEKAAVTALCWVPRGKCNVRTPGAGDMEDGDVDLQEAHAAEVAASVRNTAAASSNVNTAGLEEFNLDGYDDEPDADNGMQFFSVLNTDGDMARDKDEHFTGDPDSDSDSEGFYEIKAEDQVFTAVSCEEDNCSLELYVFDEEAASMYVHHDVMLGAYPLCIDWLNNAGTGSDGSFAAIGLIDHSIQIWDLDDMDPMDATTSLGAAKKAKKTAKGKRKKAVGATAHDGPVLCLHGNAFNRSVLASGAGDETVKVWDVKQNTCVHTYTHHKNKVQCVKWHPTEQSVLLSASFDRHLALLDVRQPNQVAMTELPAEAECAIWSRHRPFECLASVDNGGVACYDVRKVASKAPASEQVLWVLNAHDNACTAIDDSVAPNVLVTASLDAHAKVWKSDGSSPTMVMAKNLQAGPLFTCQSAPDAPALFCFGGKCPVMWDLSSESILLDVFQLGSGGGGSGQSAGV